MAGSPHPSASVQSPRSRRPTSPDSDAPSNRSPGDGKSPTRRSKRALVEAFHDKPSTRGDSRDKGSLLCNASAASEDLPVGWKVHHTQGGRGQRNLCYVTPDGVTLGSLHEATQYLEKKPISREGKKEILASLDFSNAQTAKRISENAQNGDSRPRLKRGRPVRRGRPRKQPEPEDDEDEDEEEEEPAKKRGPGRPRKNAKVEEETVGRRRGRPRKEEAQATQAAKLLRLPSYLRSRFGDRGSSLKDAPPAAVADKLKEEEEKDVKPNGKHAEKEGGGGGERRKKEDGVGEVEEMERQREARNTARRRRDNIERLPDNNILLFGQWYRKREKEGPPELEDLRAFVMDRKAYWGDEIALRVFAERFKLVVCVVLQAEERLQVIFPPGGGATALFYLVLTHRGRVPHYRAISVADRHVLAMDARYNEGPQGETYVTPGMVSRLVEDCPHGWECALADTARAFLTTNQKDPEFSTLRHPVVRNSYTLKEVTNQNVIQALRNSGSAMDSFAIGGFPEGTNFVERIVCSRAEANPPFTISKTPGDGDCLFYAMIDVATEAHRDSHLPVPAELEEVMAEEGKLTVEQLRKLVSESLTDTELAFFKAANNFM